jgi:hypothetical protein
MHLPSPFDFLPAFVLIFYPVRLFFICLSGHRKKAQRARVRNTSRRQIYIHAAPHKSINPFLRRRGQSLIYEKSHARFGIKMFLLFHCAYDKYPAEAKALSLLTVSNAPRDDAEPNCRD